MHQPSSRSPTAPSNGVATGAAADGAFGGYPQPPALNGLGMSGYSDIYGPTGLASFSGGLNGLGVNTQGQGSNPSSGFGNNPASPYLSLQGSPNPAGLGFQSSPNLNGGAFPSQQQQQQQQQSASGAPGSFNGSGHSPGGQYEALPASPNPYSPNPYAPSFVSNNGMAGAGGLADFGLATSGLGFGPGSFMGGLMSPSMMMGSPGLGSPTLSSFGSPFQGFSMGSPQLGGPAMQSGRTVYVGNLPSDASVDELLSQVRFGPIDNVKIIPEKSCAFISFLDPTTAAAFHSDAMIRKIRLHDQELRIGWGKPSAVPPQVMMAVQQSGATRNVYLGNLDETVTEQSLRDDLSRFGPIDQVKIVRDKNIGFVHFLSIAVAIKVVQTLAIEPEWAGKRINFGKDRCAYVPKNQHQQQQHNMAAAAMGSMAANYGGFGGFGNDTAGSLSPLVMAASGDPNAQPGNRTVYLGNIHPDITTEEICNAIRGGILQEIRYIPDKHICFVTFVDPACALAFYQTAAYHGIALHNRRLKIGWGKHSGPTQPGIAMVVQAGGSRNVYVGNIEDWDTFTEDRLRADFGEHGEIELVNSLKEKNCAFINFTKISNAIKAIEAAKQDPVYSGFKIAYGKDRCGGAPRSFRAFEQQLQNGMSPNMGRSPFLGMGGGFSPRPAQLNTVVSEAVENPEPAEGAGPLVLDEEEANAAATTAV